MPIEIKKEIQLEIAHVLFIDIVGYSKLSINNQHAAVEELNRIVRASEQFQRAEAANRLIRIPTGDGMVLVFYTNPEAPVPTVHFRFPKRGNTGLHRRMPQCTSIYILLRDGHFAADAKSAAGGL